MRPKREPATNNRQTYMVTSDTWGRRALFRAERWARLFLDTLYHYRGSAYLLHEFVVMPEHIHVLITPTGSLERAVQMMKGGFSFRAKKELGSNMEVWQVGFSDHRIRDAVDYETHVAYIRMNPVRKHLTETAEMYPYSSAFPGFELDEAPQGLKPLHHRASSGGAEAPPFQSKTDEPQGLKSEGPKEPVGAAKAAPFQSQEHHVPQALKPLSKDARDGGPEGAPFQDEESDEHQNSAAEPALQSKDAKT